MPNGGEIDVLDPANYGAITATHTLSIVGRGWATLSPVAGQAAITINAGPSDKIAISGLTLDGANLTNTIGIQFNSGGSLTVRDSVIQNCTRYGILYQPNSSTLTKISMSNIQVSDNNFGIYIGPVGSGITHGVLDHVHVDNNAADGITIIGTQDIKVTVTDSVIANNGGSGVVETAEDDGINLFTFVRNSTIVNNDLFGLESVNPVSAMFFTRNLIAANGGSPDSQNSGFLASYNDNNIDENSGTASPITILPYK
ncbi:MAG TPA: right-handed parallel beta-helix repeat-containing protein [Lacipirellulaceae bacterium]|nr:right-handed parallel beta-helix repeat-containing protein [Lacipirellulaceae bacterium]